jgi:hypothetical protein
MADDNWRELKAALVAHLGILHGELRTAGQTDAAEMFAAVAASPPESQFGTASDWLGEVELVAEAVLRRFPPPPPLDRKVREAKRLARAGLYGESAVG